MDFDDLKQMYEKKREQHGDNAYKYISELLREAKARHKEDFLRGKTAQRAREEGRIPDHEQSRKPWKGANLEKLIQHIIQYLRSRGSCPSLSPYGDKPPTGTSSVTGNLTPLICAHKQSFMPVR